MWMKAQKNTIKKLVNKKLKDKIEEVRQAKVPGLEAYKKAFKASGTENKEYHKDFEKKFKNYQDFEGNSNPEFPHQESSTTADGYQKYENTTDDEEFIDDFAFPGLQDFDVHNQDMKRLTDYLDGSSETGNAQVDKDGKPLGNVVPSDLG